MPTVRDILAVKGGQVLSIGPEATVLEGALLMNEHKIGSLVVMEGNRVCGMFTERDILRRVVAERRDPTSTRIREVMTSEVVCCQLDTKLDEARGVMKNRRIRHLPVLDDGDGLIGLISIGDLNAHESQAREVTIHVLEEYIHGRA